MFSTYNISSSAVSALKFRSGGSNLKGLLLHASSDAAQH
jgi:hypothetical protein